MGIITTILLFIVVIAIVVIVHELGHFLAGVLTRTKIFEFNIGMGPKIASVKKKEIDFNIRAVPIGGSVNFGSQYDSVSENELSEELKKDDKNAIYNKSILQRLFIFAAGPLMNFVLAILIFVGLFGYYGVPALSVAEVIAGSPAQEAGLRAGDILVGVNGEKLMYDSSFTNIVGQSAGISQEIEVLRDNESMIFNITPEYDEEANRALIGILLGSSEVKMGAFSTISFSVKYTFNQIRDTLVAIGGMFRGTEEVSLSGPIGIAQVSGEAAKQGFDTFLWLIAMISISLGFMNLLPIPILDGGWILLLLIEGIRKKPLPQNVETGLKLAGLVLIFGVFIFATYSDIVRLVGGGV